MLTTYFFGSLNKSKILFLTEPNISTKNISTFLH